jgi:unsaturated chondroitin disaccharide hydrolase
MSKSTLSAGMSIAKTHRVTFEETVAARGIFDLEVLASPQMIFLLEDACAELVIPHLGPGEVTVGTHVDIYHRTAVGPGQEIIINSRVESVEPPRIRFAVSAHTADGHVVGEGRHDRQIVTLARLEAGVRRTAEKSDNSTPSRPGQADAGLDLLMERVSTTAQQVGRRFPHWADPATGRWTTTKSGDWPGGAWLGMLWCGIRLGRTEYRSSMSEWMSALKRQLEVDSVFRGFPFYYGCALGDLLLHDREAGAIAEDCSRRLMTNFDDTIGVIPLGNGAEEGGYTGRNISSIDSLQATPLLYWLYQRTADPDVLPIVRSHTERVLAIHQRADGSIIQSSELDPRSGNVVRYFTHKGYSENSVWGRAQAWGILYSALAAARDEKLRPRLLGHATAAADWWIAHLPADGVAFWDFDDPTIPNCPKDTAATSIASAGLLKLAAVLGAPAGQRYRKAAEKSLLALVARHLTPTSPADKRPRGMLIDACFNNRSDSRPEDATSSAEFIVGSYFLMEGLMIMTGAIGPLEL